MNFVDLKIWLLDHSSFLDTVWTDGKDSKCFSGRARSTLGKGGPGGEDRNVGDKLPGDPCTKKKHGGGWGHGMG